MIIQKGKWLEYEWFSEKPNLGFRTIYKQSTDIKNYFFFKKVPFYTKLIDLTQSVENLRSQFAKNTNYEINRAIKRDNIITGIEENMGKALVFFNTFAQLRNLETIPLSRLESYGDNLVITRAYAPQYNQLISVHFLLKDKKSKRVSMLCGGTLVEKEMDKTKRSMIGRVNRLHHFSNMSFFKEQGFEVYDFGGYAPNTTDKSLMGINKFKDHFGGKLVEESHYYPIWIYLFLKLVD